MHDEETGVEKKRVGMNIKSIRLSLGMTLEQFSQLFSPSSTPSIVSKWERGVSLPKPERLKKIAEVSGQTVADIMRQVPAKEKIWRVVKTAEVDKQCVGMRIKQVRELQGLSMKAFGKLVSDSPRSTVNNWEKGMSVPKAQTLENIAILGNTTVHYLLYGVTEMK